METVFTSPHEIERDVQRLAASGYVAVHLDRNAKLCIAQVSPVALVLLDTTSLLNSRPGLKSGWKLQGRETPSRGFPPNRGS